MIPLLAGFIIAIGASRQFSKVGTNIIPLSKSSALVTDGMFQYSRNPMYLGMVLALGGAALLTGGVLNWLVVVGFFYLIRTRFVLHEEPLMTETFGEPYRQYCARVRRWV